ncbi:hypothetical protein LWC34_02060 [Kibdelosporangium philippinense]|uniref:Uncharacterized protein n=1 Tax=Kibdelosporangium philippinense TaxID=211113 RepID=A0ABS8Z4Q8_9PSEU|nr:hypothetical protein [Kibdelosporangium philippinense]MCE7001631.1 hypothetical protein [Kibdelosporangium philippinense]
MTDDVWQPYADEPLLTPEMTLGPHAVHPMDLKRLGNYLSALLEVRRAPIHVNVAFNAVYFGYDLSKGGYVGGPLDLDAFPVVAFGKAADALPVGAMVNIATGSEPLFAEVIYKEGKHDLLNDDGTLPSWISGAPVGATGPGEASDTGTPARTERLVIDVDAFGQGLSTTTSQLDRLRRRGKWLDAYGHLVLTATYASPSDAKLDDVTCYARYLLTRGRNQLLSAAAPAPLSMLLIETAGEEQLAIALTGIQRTLAAVLASAEELRTWRGYTFTRRSLARRLHDQGPLGGADMSSIAVQLSRSAVPSCVSRWRSNPSPAYTAIGPRLREVNGARESLAGLGYAEAVCHANAIISDYACRETNEETGLLSGNVHLRLDDPWEGGGVWRAEHPTSDYLAVDVTEPLGLGWLATLPEPDLIVDRHHENDPVDLSVTDSQISWTQPLRLSHMLDRHTPLPDRVVSHIRAAGLDSARMRLLLTHDGRELDPSETVQCVQTRLAGKPRLEGIDWPIEFFPGILLTYTWSYGAGVLRATTTLLDYPVTVDGKQIEHRYAPGILTREAAPGLDRRGKAATLAQRCACRKCRPCRSSGVVVLVEDAAQTWVSADVELTGLSLRGDRHRQWL